MFTSEEGGSSWERGFDTTRSRSGCSDVVMLDEDRAGLLYETGMESGDARDTIVFQVADLSEP